MSGAVLHLLADTSIRSTLAALLVAATLAALRPASGAVRHASWTAVLFAMLLMPGLARWTPIIEMPLAVPALPEPLVDGAFDLLPGVRGSDGALPNGGATPAAANATTAAHDSPVGPAVAAPLATSADASGRDFWLAMACAIYGVVAAAMMVRFLIGWWGAVRMRRAAHAVILPRECLSFLKEGAALDIRESRSVVVPVTIGLLRQSILLPIAWRQWPVETLRAALAHEAAHISRCDVPIAFAAHLNHCLWWFHPLSWWIERTLAATAEQAADETAMAVLRDRAAYAAILVEMARAVTEGRGRVAWCGVGIDGSGLLHQRIERALHDGAPREMSVMRKAMLAVTCIGAILIAAAGRPSAASLAAGAPVAPGTTGARPSRVADLTLASRLAWFLWNSEPDAELIAAAARGTLKDRRVLDQQVRRMLRDQRSSALVSNVFNAWLNLRLGLRFDSVVFPDFDDSLRQAFSRETELFLESQLHEDRGAMELLTADYTFVNERLARHYRIGGISGGDFRRVTLEPDQPRRGLLGQGSILAVTSYSHRTSPVLRGKWLLEVMLGRPTTAATVNMPALGEDIPGKPTSLRLRMALQAKDPGCARCHGWIDPLGFALENFNAIGQWRTSEGDSPINSSATLPDGTQLDGPGGLRQYLVAHHEEFVGMIVGKLMTYAIGRGGEPTAIHKIVNDAAGSNYRWSSLILGIVRSTPFQTTS